MPDITGWDAAKLNIDWVFKDEGARGDFYEAYQNEHDGIWRALFGNSDETAGYHNAYRAVLYAQRHNEAARDSIKNYMGQSVEYLQQKGFRAEGEV